MLREYPTVYRSQRKIEQGGAGCYHFDPDCATNGTGDWAKHSEKYALKAGVEPCPACVGESLQERREAMGHNLLYSQK